MKTRKTMRVKKTSFWFSLEPKGDGSAKKTESKRTKEVYLGQSEEFQAVVIEEYAKDCHKRLCCRNNESLLSPFPLDWNSFFNIEKYQKRKFRILSSGRRYFEGYTLTTLHILS